MDGGTETTKAIIGAAIAVHRELGPGLLESIYEDCLVYELAKRDVPVERQKWLPVVYQGVLINERGYRLDLLVANEVVVELKAVDRTIPAHEAQLLTYLRLSGMDVGLLLNFNVRLMKEGIRRMVWTGSRS